MALESAVGVRQAEGRTAGSGGSGILVFKLPEVE